MKKQHIFYLIAGIIALILVIGGWCVYKYRNCIEKISYIPSREQKSVFLDPLRLSDKGTYYIFYSREFRTSEEAMRACIWK